MDSIGKDSKLSRDYARETCITGASGLGAALLISCGLIATSSSLYCLALPGVNAIRDVVLPGVLPGVLAIACSIPLIVVEVKHNQVKNALWEEWIDQICAHLEEALPSKEKKERVDYINREIVDKVWTPMSKSALFTALSKRYEDNENGLVAKALKEARQASAPK